MGLWTELHAATLFPALAIFSLIAYLMRRWLMGKPYEIRMLPIKIIAIILIIIEILKQAVSVMRGYNLYHIPLHFCSIFIYALPLMAFYRGRHAEKLRSFATAAMTALFFGMLVMPSVIYSEEFLENFFCDYLAFHSVFFHNLVILALFLVYALDLHQPSGKRNELIFLTASGGAFVIAAASASHILETNFSNFLGSTVGLVASLEEKVSAAIGELTTDIIYTASLAILHIALIILTNYVFLFACRLKDKCNK